MPLPALRALSIPETPTVVVHVQFQAAAKRSSAVSAFYKALVLRVVPVFSSVPACVKPCEEANPLSRSPLADAEEG